MQSPMQSSTDEMLKRPQPRAITWHNGQVGTDSAPGALQEILRDPQALIWLDLADDGRSQQALLRGVFGLAPITLQTMTETMERAKLLEQDHYFYLVVHGMAFDPQTNAAQTPKLDILFGQNFVITAHSDTIPWLDAMFDIIADTSTDEHLMSRGVAYLLYALLDELVDSYFPVLDDLDDIIDDLEDATVNSTSNEVQVRIFHIKRSLVQLRRVISPQLEVANALVVRASRFIPAQAQPYFVDMHDHMIRAFEVLDSYRDLMSGILDVYLTTVSNRLNVVMKQLAIISTIFLPITFITGVFGQNFGHLPQVEFDNGSFFWVMLGIMLLITAFQIWLFRKRGWL